MNENLLKLKKEFGKYGSWALWNEDGSIAPLIDTNNFEFLLKPDIIFVGLNASRKMPEKDWINFHSESCKSTWKREHARKLAEVLQEKEYEVFKGAYMTDIVKNHYDADSDIVINKIKQNTNLLSKNISLFEHELKLLSEISGTDKFHIICIGNKSFEILNQVLKHKIYKIWHYSAYQLGQEGVKEKIRQDLRAILKKM